MIAALALLLMLACGPAAAQALQLPPPPAARFDPVPGTRLPLDAVLRDDAGQPVRLAALFDRPVVLVPGYYRSGEGRKVGALRMLRVLRTPGPLPAAWRPPRMEDPKR